MNLSKLPEKKNITAFSDEELLLWLKDYIEGWAKIDVKPSIHYEAIKTELTRRSNEKIFNLTEKLHRLTVVLVNLTEKLHRLTVVLVILAVISVILTFVSIFQ